MSLVFYCTHCTKKIEVRFLNTGDVAKCKTCGASMIVPDNADGQSEATAPKRESSISNVAEDRLSGQNQTEVKFNPSMPYSEPDSYFSSIFKMYIDYMAGKHPLDPRGTYKLNPLLQYCVYHITSYHMDSILLNGNSRQAWLVKGTTCNIHRASLSDIDASERELLRISDDFPVANPVALAGDISLGYAIPRREIQLFICDRCTSISVVKEEIQRNDWPNYIVRKYARIWVDWSL